MHFCNELFSRSSFWSAICNTKKITSVSKTYSNLRTDISIIFFISPFFLFQLTRSISTSGHCNGVLTNGGGGGGGDHGVGVGGNHSVIASHTHPGSPYRSSGTYVIKSRSCHTSAITTRCKIWSALISLKFFFSSLAFPSALTLGTEGDLPGIVTWRAFTTPGTGAPITGPP